MLFLDTYEVKAASTGAVNCSGSVSFVLHPQSGSNGIFPTSFNFTESGYIGSSGSTISNSGSGSIVSTGTYESYYYLELEIPLMYVLGNSDDFGDYLAFDMYDLNVSANQGSIINSYLHVGDTTTLISYPMKKGPWVWYVNNVGQITCRPTLHCIYSFSRSDYTQMNQQINVTINYSFTGGCYDITEEAYNNSVPSSVDTGTHERLDNLNDTEEAVKDSVTNPDPNGKGLFETISDFFGGFFSNIINSLISVFVPEDGFFSTWFDNLNTLLSDKLGMLYAPFDLLVSTLQSIYLADSSETGIPFPGIQWDDTWLISPFTFTFDSLGDGFTEFRDKVYFGTDTVLIFAFLVLLQKKVRLILEGHET